MNRNSGMFPLGGTSVNIFPGDTNLPDYNAYMQEYMRRMGFGAPQDVDPVVEQHKAIQEQQRVQQMLYDYLFKVWGIPQDVFDCGFEEYKKQLQQQEEKRLEETREFVRKKLSGENSGVPGGVPGNVPKEVPSNVVTAGSVATNDVVKK